MQCTSPFFLKSQGFAVPCGRCLACRITRSSSWAVRIAHELIYFKESSFITLTYSNENLPFNYSISKAELQRYFKRVRKALSPGTVFKYFACGEYGEKTSRPHYHVLAMGAPVDVLKSAWSFGFVHVGYDTSRSAIRYITDYICKKYIGKDAKEYYAPRSPPFQLFSKGLGLRYALDNRSHIESIDCIKHEGSSVAIPRYYRKKLDITNDKAKEFILSRQSEQVELLKKFGIELDTSQELEIDYYCTSNGYDESVKNQMVLNARMKIFHEASRDFNEAKLFYKQRRNRKNQI